MPTYISIHAVVDNHVDQKVLMKKQISVIKLVVNPYGMLVIFNLVSRPHKVHQLYLCTLIESS